MDLKELKIKSKNLEPIVRIGKAGITTAQIEEIKKLLKKRKLVKIKMLNNFIDKIDRKAAAKELTDKTDAVLVDAIGSVVVLYKNN